MDFAITSGIITLIICIIISVPIGLSLIASVMVTVFFSPLPPEFLMLKLISSLDSFPLLAVPFFILAGEIMSKGSLAQSLLKLSKSLVGHLTGGMAHISVLTCMFYGALSGSSPATVAAVGGIMIPAMEKEGYSKSFSTAVNAAGGCLGVMIPPSVPLIIYGTSANVSVSDLFIAGVLPGIFIGLLLMLISYYLCKKYNYQTKKEPYSGGVLKALYEAKYALLVPLIVLGGIYGGITTPTESGAIAVLYAFLIEIFVIKTLTFKKMIEIFKTTSITSASIFIIVAGATAFGQLLMIYNIPNMLVDLLSGITTNRYVLLLVLIFLLLIIGTFMDALASILILTPLLQPLVMAAGIDMTHFGIVMIVAVSLGFLTPPVGLNLFVGCGISGVRIEQLSKAVIPFIGIMLLGVIILAFVPFISLCLI